MAAFLAVKNYEAYQHYKDRNPPWIKLHYAIFDDYEFSKLSDETKYHLIAIWLLASRHNNRIPADETWIAARILAQNSISITPLLEAGFLYYVDEKGTVLDDCYQGASVMLPSRAPARSLEAEAETETKKPLSRNRDRVNNYEQQVATVIEFLNRKTHKRFRQQHPNGALTKNAKLISARLREGYSVEEMTFLESAMEAHDRIREQPAAGDAFDAMMRYRAFEETEKRRAFDQSYRDCRQAAGLPLQSEMFEAA